MPTLRPCFHSIYILHVTLMSHLLAYIKLVSLHFKKDNGKITLSQHIYQVPMALDLLQKIIRNLCAGNLFCSYKVPIHGKEIQFIFTLKYKTTTKKWQDFSLFQD